MKKIFIVVSLLAMVLFLSGCENKNGGGSGGEKPVEETGLSYAQFKCSATIDAHLLDYIVVTSNITGVDGSQAAYTFPTEPNGTVGDIPVIQKEYTETSESLPAAVVFNFIIEDNGSQVEDSGSVIDAYLASVLEINVYNTLGQIVKTERQENTGGIQKDLPIGMLKQYLKFFKVLSLEITLSVDGEGNITVTTPELPVG